MAQALRVPVFRTPSVRSAALAAFAVAAGAATLHLLPTDLPAAARTAAAAALLAVPALAVWLSGVRPQAGLPAAIAALRGGDRAPLDALAGRGGATGAAAGVLADLAARLTEGEARAAEAAFKGAAFSGSSAAMMLLDRDFTILHLNPALEKLMTDYGAAFRADVPDFDHRRIVGGNMDMFHARRPQVRQVLADRKNLPYRAHIRLGEERLTIEVAWVADAAGTHLGYVAEWKRVTDIQRQEALIGALDTAQLRLEMNPDGRVTTANAAFLALAGQPLEQLRGQDLLRAIRLDGEPVAETLRAGQTATGLFSVELAGVGRRLLDGVLAPAKDHAGRPMLAALVARDVTEERQAAEARAERDARTRADQARVVATLGTALGDLARGRLSARIDAAFPPDYESLRVDFNAASGTLAEALARVVDSAESIRTEANEIASASTDLNRRTEQQAATLEQTAAALDQLTASVQSAAAVAEAARNRVETAQGQAGTGAKVVNSTIAAMQEIADGSTKISKITSVIDEIAFQTNLLALNAGVEAARAGEAGRGFAVVASEVRALAQRSSEAAREIADLIDLSASQVRRGVTLVDEAGHAIREIADSVGEMRQQISGISTSATEQATGIREINVAVNQLDQVTQQNAALAEETNAATQSLLSMSSDLIGSTARFDLGTAPAPATATFARAPAAAPRKVAAAGGSGPRAAPAMSAAAQWEEF